MSEPNKITIFTSSHCPPCKPVKRALRKLVQTAAGTTLLSEIDADTHSDITQTGHIRSVPHVLLNGVPILTGRQANAMMSSGLNSLMESPSMGFDAQDSNDSIFFTYLLNKIIEANIRAEEATPDRTLQAALFSVSSPNFDWSSTLRPSVGDFVHIGYLQTIIASLLAQNPVSKYYLYHAGYLSGKVGTTQGWLLQANTEILKANDSSTRFKAFLDGVASYYGGNRPQSTKIASKIEYDLTSKQRATLKVYESAFAAQNIVLNQDMCAFFAGEVAGLTEPILGEPISIQETQCVGKGAQMCEFVLDLDFDRSNYYQMENFFQAEFFSTEDRLRFEVSLAEISKNMFNSVLNPTLNPIRSGLVGDFIHISILQQIILSLKFADPFNSALLKFAGQKYGQMLEDVGSIRRLMTRYDKHQGFPLDFKDACQILGYYLNSPGTTLSRIHSTVTVKMIDDDSAVFKVWENAASSGIDLYLPKNIELPPEFDLEKVGLLDDFMAGFIEGRLDLLIEDDVTVLETKCQSLGAPFCEFVAEL